MSTIKKNSLKGELLRKTRLIIWDEVSMQHRFTLEAIDRTLRDFINQPDLPFGGITVAFEVIFSRHFLLFLRAQRKKLLEPAFNGLGCGGISRSFT